MLKELGKLSMIISEVRLLDGELPIQTLDLFVEIAKHPEGVSLVDIQQKLGLDTSSMSRNKQALTERHWIKGRKGLGLVYTEEDPVDIRRKLLKLTPKGKRFVEQLVRIIQVEGGKA